MNDGLDLICVDNGVDMEGAVIFADISEERIYAVDAQCSFADIEDLCDVNPVWPDLNGS